MAFLNNLLEIRSDAFKMTVHNRRPVPTRTDTIGPWLDALTFLAWIGALTNSALVYLFSPDLLPSTAASVINVVEVTANTNDNTLFAEEHLVSAASAGPWGIDGSSSATLAATKELLMKAALIALLASHGYIIVRTCIRHVVEKVFWRNSGEVEQRERTDREVKKQFLKGSGVQLSGEVIVERESWADEEVTDDMEFWDHDDGVDEIQRISKEA